MDPKLVLQILNDAHIPSIWEEGHRYKNNTSLETLKNNLHGGVTIKYMGISDGGEHGIPGKYFFEMYKKVVDGKFVESE